MVVKVGRRLATNIFLNEKLIDLYLSITSGPLNYVCKIKKLNYSHAISILNIWESMGLVVKNKSGYRYNIFYTQKGRVLADSLGKMKVYMKRNKLQWVGDDNNDM